MKIRYLRFERRGDSDRLPQPVFSVTTMQSGIFLGNVRFFPSWRRFAFVPVIDHRESCALDPDRLQEISEFLEWLPIRLRDEARTAAIVELKPPAELTDEDIFGE